MIACHRAQRNYSTGHAGRCTTADLHASDSIAWVCLQSQASIASTVLRMMSLLLWFVTMIVLLLVLGVEMNTVVMSGAAFLSAITVSLSTFLCCTAFHAPSQQFIGQLNAQLEGATSKNINIGSIHCSRIHFPCLRLYLSTLHYSCDLRGFHKSV